MSSCGGAEREPAGEPPRQAAMDCLPARLLPTSLARLSRLALTGLLVLVVAACSSAAGPSSSPTPPASPGLGAGSDPNDPVGSDLPPVTDDPGRPDPAGRVVVPKPGQLDVHPLPAQSFSAAVDGRHLVVTIAFTSGVEPCSILDSILVERGPGSYTMTLREGHGPGDVVCIEIAESKRAVVDLGDVEPGTYDIVDGAGGAAPISVTIA
jgi:hypothetical protein